MPSKLDKKYSKRSKLKYLKTIFSPAILKSYEFITLPEWLFRYGGYSEVPEEHPYSEQNMSEKWLATKISKG